MASGRINVALASSYHVPRMQAYCVLSLSLRFSTRHKYTLLGSYFEKNDKTLFRYTSHSSLGHSFCALHSFHALSSCNHLVSDLFHSRTRGFFSAFAHATCSLSVYNQYLGLGFNAPIFTPTNQPELLFCSKSIILNLRDYHSLWLRFSVYSAHTLDQRYPTSLLFYKSRFRMPFVAFTRVTYHIAFAFSSCRY